MKTSIQKMNLVMQSISKYSFILIMILSLLIPVVFIRAAGTGTSTESGFNTGTGTSTGSGLTINSKIENPLPNGPQTIPEFIKKIIEIVLVVGVPLLVLAFIYAGFLFVKAQGNSGEIEVAKRTFVYTIIGGALLLGAFVIADAIGQTVKDIGNGV